MSGQRASRVLLAGGPGADTLEGEGEVEALLDAPRSSSTSATTAPAPRSTAPHCARFWKVYLAVGVLMAVALAGLAVGMHFHAEAELLKAYSRATQDFGKYKYLVHLTRSPEVAVHLALNTDGRLSGPAMASYRRALNMYLKKRAE